MDKEYLGLIYYHKKRIVGLQTNLVYLSLDKWTCLHMMSNEIIISGPWEFFWGGNIKNLTQLNTFQQEKTEKLSPIV